MDKVNEKSTLFLSG